MKFSCVASSRFEKFKLVFENELAVCWKLTPRESLNNIAAWWGSSVPSARRPTGIIKENSLISRADIFMQPSAYLGFQTKLFVVPQVQLMPASYERLNQEEQKQLINKHFNWAWSLFLDNNTFTFLIIAQTFRRETQLNFSPVAWLFLAIHAL